MLIIVRIFIIMIYFYNFIMSDLTVPNFSNYTQDHLISSAIEIANDNFNFRKYSVVISKDVEEQNVNTFLQFYKGTLMVETKRIGQSPAQVVLILESYQAFMRIWHKLKPDLKGNTLLNGWTNFLIVLLKSSFQLGHITKTFWTYHATNLLILTKAGNQTAMYTYYPYKNHLNCQNTKPTLLGFWRKNAGMKLFPDKMKNMKGCPLYVSNNKLYHPATEKKIPLQTIKRQVVKLLQDVMNFTPMISEKDYVSIDSDRAKNWSDSLNDVISGKANLSTCTIPLGINTLELLDYSAPYFGVRLAWVSPPLTTGSVYWRLLSPLSGYLWLGLMVVLVFVTSLPFVFKVRPVQKFCNKYFRNMDKLQGITIRVWGVMMGQPIRIAPKRLRDFYIVSLWMWFTFVIRNAYQSVLIGALKTDTVVGSFVDIKEVTENGVRYGGRGGIFVHLEHDPKIRDGFEIITEDKFEGVIKSVLEGREQFVLATSLEYAWAYCLAKGKRDEECFHVLTDPILTLPLVVWMKMHSPFKRSLDMWINRFIQSGLLSRGLVLTSPPTAISSDPTPLTRHQILSCIICLAFGFTISSVVFVFEVFGSKYKMLGGDSGLKKAKGLAIIFKCRPNMLLTARDRKVRFNST